MAGLDRANKHATAQAAWYNGYTPPRSQMEKKPKLKLIGNDGNAFAIMAACRKAGMKAGWSTDRISDLLKRMMSGNYDNLLTIAAEEFDVS
jgi:hypothetical protein